MIFFKMSYKHILGYVLEEIERLILGAGDLSNGVSVPIVAPARAVAHAGDFVAPRAVNKFRHGVLRTRITARIAD